MSFLQVKGSNIVLDDRPILLKGAALGGWMMMENFITGFAGHEFQLRAELQEGLGAEKAEFFLDKFLEYFFSDEDAALFAQLGLNCLRIPINYRHFEDDMKPGEYKETGFKHLDRVIDSCSRHGIYSVIDLHAAPGGQNNDWHCDAGNHQANFWVHRDFQDRTVNLWKHIAQRYKDHTWVAGYNVLNEPTDQQHTRLLDFYARITPEIRAIDPYHIFFLDGNNYGADFSRFKERPLIENAVYSCHDYSPFGFPSSKERFTGADAQHATHVKQLERKIEFAESVKAPVWNGEFGPVYANDKDPDASTINESRLGALQDQLGIYQQRGISWSLWLWKDVGQQGLVHVKEDTPYMKMVEAFIAKKKRLAADSWGNDTTHVAHLFAPIEEWLLAEVPGITSRYPKIQRQPTRSVARLLREILLSDELIHEYGALFEGKTLEELDNLAKSFSLGSCHQRIALHDVLKRDAQKSPETPRT